jgi:chromosomal replication initiator protein
MNKTAQSVWENCLSFIKDNIQDQIKTWFEPIKSVELTDNALYIQVPSFFYEWLEEHYVKLL